MKKLVLSLLTVCLCVTALTGCGKQNEEGLTKVTLSEVVQYYKGEETARETIQ